MNQQLQKQKSINAHKLKALKEEIKEGLESGDSIPFDAEAIKKKAREHSKRV